MLKVTYACDKEMIVINTPRPATNNTSENNSNTINTPTFSGDHNSKPSPRPPTNSNVGNAQLIEALRDILYTLMYDTMQVMKKEVRLFPYIIADHVEICKLSDMFAKYTNCVFYYFDMLI